jgi:hypothetical protein
VSITLGLLVCRRCGRLNLLGDDVGVTGAPVSPICCFAMTR